MYKRQAQAIIPAAAEPVAPAAILAAPSVMAEAAQTVAPWQLDQTDAPELAEQAIAAVAPDQNQPLVMRADRLGALLAWLQHNWVYAISALSLALAGVFFVQYGMEKGPVSYTHLDVYKRQRHQRSPGTRPAKPYSGRGVDRSLPRYFDIARNSAVMIAQTVCNP